MTFSCRLPTVTFDTNGNSISAGFISFPAGTYAPDRSASTKSHAYDRAYGRWLPVDWRWISDDGSRYVYGTYVASAANGSTTNTIHLVNAATGADHILTTGAYQINDYTGGSIYLSALVGAHDGPGPQIQWSLDPFTGAVHQLIGGAKYGYWIGGGAGWRMEFNPADTTPQNAPFVTNQLTRVDLTTGRETAWYYQPGTQWVQLVTFDLAGHPVIETSTGGDSYTAWLLIDATHRSKLFTWSDQQGVFYIALADSHGIWFSDSKSTYLYDRNGFRKVSPTGGSIAGGCH